MRDHCGQPTVVNLWLAYMPAATTELELNPAWLSEHECARAKRFRLEADRLRFERTRLLLKLLLARDLACDPASVRINLGLHGRPVQSDAAHQTQREFNVAHSGDWTLIGISGAGKIGVDIELLCEVPEHTEIAEHHFARRELAQLLNSNSLSHPAAFYKLWTRKEACLKAIGLGIPGGLDRFDVLTDARITPDPCAERAGFIQTVGARGANDVLWVGTINIQSPFIASVAFDGEFAIPQMHAIGIGEFDLPRLEFLPL